MRIYNQALGAGAHSLQEPADQFYGDRNARFEDPFGNEWAVMTHVKNVSKKEMKRAMAQMGTPPELSPRLTPGLSVRRALK